MDFTFGNVWQQTHFNYVPNSGRNRQKLTLIEYDSKRRAFKALQLRNASEMKMGIRRHDGHYFFAEEVVWMVEAGIAVVHRRADGRQLSVQQCYRLLGTFLVTPAKYLVYSYLKRAGYVALPHNALRTSTDRCPASDTREHSPKPKSHFPSQLLDQFPNFVSMTLTMKSLHNNPKLMETFGVSEYFSEHPIKAIKLDEQSEERRNSREFLRPRYWPRFDEFANRAASWSDYRVQRATILHGNDRLQQRVPISDSSNLPIDYDVYVGDSTFCRSLYPKPIYQLLVVDMQLPFPSVANLHWLSSQISEGRLLVAVVQHTAIVFYNINYQTVRL